MSSDDANPDESFTKRLQEYQQAAIDEGFEKATDAARDIFALAEAGCEENPSLSLDLTLRAAELEECADWDAAESVYKQILSSVDLEPGIEYKAHANLAGLCRLLQRDADALIHARRATATARRADLPILLFMSLQVELRCLIRCGQVAAASTAIAEAIAAMDEGPQYNQLLASFLTMRAECAICNCSLAKAEHDLQQAYRLLEPLARMELAAGVHGDLSRWWSAKARLCTACGDQDDAIAAWQKAVEISGHAASLPHADHVYAKAAVAESLKGLAEALFVCDRAGDATAELKEHKEILNRIGLTDYDAE